jgi:hypothetical protein
VQKDLENNKIVKAVVIYLPDLSNPQFLQIQVGLGSKKIDLKLAD